jgi:hypothetical protein
VHEALASHAEGKGLLKTLQKTNAAFEQKERKLFVKILVENLIKQTGHQ